MQYNLQMSRKVTPFVSHTIFDVESWNDYTNNLLRIQNSLKSARSPSSMQVARPLQSLHAGTPLQLEGFPSSTGAILPCHALLIGRDSAANSRRITTTTTMMTTMMSVVIPTANGAKERRSERRMNGRTDGDGWTDGQLRATITFTPSLPTSPL